MFRGIGIDIGSLTRLLPDGMQQKLAERKSIRDAKNASSPLGPINLTKLNALRDQHVPKFGGDKWKEMRENGSHQNRIDPRPFLSEKSVLRAALQPLGKQFKKFSDSLSLFELASRSEGNKSLEFSRMTPSQYRDHLYLEEIKKIQSETRSENFHSKLTELEKIANNPNLSMKVREEARSVLSIFNESPLD